MTRLADSIDGPPRSSLATVLPAHRLKHKMAQSRTLSLPVEPLPVFQAVFEAAATLGLTRSAFDREAGSIYLDERHGVRGVSRHFSVSVTDNGLGGTTVQVSWRGAPRTVTRSHARTAARLCKLIRADLDSRWGGEPS